MFTKACVLLVAMVGLSQAAVHPRMPELSLMQFLMKSRAIGEQNPTRSIGCFSIYIPELNKATEDFEAAYAQCQSEASAQRDSINDTTQDDRKKIDSSASSACEALSTCSKVTAVEPYFECYANSGNENTKVMYEISADASELLASIREEYRVITVNEWACTNKTQRAYVETSSVIYDNLDRCLSGLEPLTTAAPPTESTAAPVETTPAPVEPTQAPIEPTQAPVEPTQAPVEPTQAPVEPTQAPVEPTQAPVEPTQAPVEPTQAPVEPTQAPVEPTQAPVESTEAPVEPTQAPVEPTQAPVEPTQAPVESTEAPVEPTQAPVEPTQAPVEPTQAPVESTEAPVEPTQAPVEPTQAPVEPTQAPVEPTQAPVESTEAPVEPTQAPVEPTQAPVESTEAPVEPTEPSKQQLPEEDLSRLAEQETKLKQMINDMKQWFKRY